METSETYDAKSPSRDLRNKSYGRIMPRKANNLKFPSWYKTMIRFASHSQTTTVTLTSNVLQKSTPAERTQNDQPVTKHTVSSVNGNEENGDNTTAIMCSSCDNNSSTTYVINLSSEKPLTNPTR
jgi:hypothetical protein